ncbi:MAG TPA: alpha-ketoglutarate-dependent dioxygenase AlkB [Segetibacter sp.]|jgi:alkylated DNA repair dioxygenase AlkB
MNTLFPIESIYPSGYSYLDNFITREEENILLEEISKTELHEFVFKGFTANRKVASFGYDYSFENGSLNKGKEIPSAFNFLIEKVSAHLQIQSSEFAELLVIEYPEKCVMNWHRDAPPFGIIAGISLLSDCVFRLRPQEKIKQTRTSVISIPVKRRSLYVMQGESRSEWQHSVSPVKQKRYSITLRTLKA